MTRRTRQIIFYGLFLIFILLGTSVAFYAQGWRFDFTKWRFEKVGAIFLRTFPKDAQIRLDGTAIANRNGLLSRGTLIADLFPKSYELVLAKDGYADWRERVNVSPSLVTELKYAVLVPKQPVMVVTTTLKRFGAYSPFDFDKSTSANLSALLAKNGVSAKSVAATTIDPYDATKIVVQNPSRIWLVDLMASAVTQIEKTPRGSALGPSVAISPSSLAWTRFSASSHTSALVLYDKFAETTATSTSAAAGRNVSLSWVKNGVLGVLQDDGSLYLYDASANNTGTNGIAANGLQKLADDVTSFTAADDGSLIAALERKSLEIFSFTDANVYHRFNLPDVASAERAIWYKDLNHLFIAYPNRVSFLDLDDLGLANFTTIAHGTAPLYNSAANALYLLSPARTLLRFDFPS